VGFTCLDASKLIDAYVAIVERRLNQRVAEVMPRRRDISRLIKRARRKPHSDHGFPPEVLAMTPSEVQKWIQHIAYAEMFGQAGQMTVVDQEAIAQESSLPVGVVRSFFDAFTCPPTAFDPQHHSFPGGAHPLIFRPILKVGDGWVIPVPSSLADALRPRMEDLLSTDVPLWNRYLRHRGRYVERTATALLGSALPHSSNWHSVDWEAEDESGELDGLVHCDDLTIRIQCKSGRISAPTRRGATPRMRRDLGQLIADGADQHRALEVAIEESSLANLGFDESQQAALNAMFQIEAIVCLDDVTVWSTEAHRLTNVGLLSVDRAVPWVVSLCDLMVVTEMIQGPLLAQYLLRRLRLERHGRVGTHDELDWLGNYMVEGLYFDRMLEEGFDELYLSSFTEAFDDWYFTVDGLRKTPAPKPARLLPKHLASYLQRLEDQHPRHWMSASLAMIEGDGKSLQAADDAVVHIANHVASHGWSNFSLVFSGNFGLTLSVDLRISYFDLLEEIRAYGKGKASELNQPNWIVIGEASEGQLAVFCTQRDDGRRLADVLTTPSEVVVEAGTDSLGA